jgi:predicted lipid-binding transport protein (Tim44 family)
MESNPALGLLGFWMMLQLFATLALLAGGIYLMFCLGRTASSLDRMASAMEEWVALQTQRPPNQNPFLPHTGSTPGVSAPIPSASPAATSFTPAASPQREYSQPETTHEAPHSDETQSTSS